VSRSHRSTTTTLRNARARARSPGSPASPSHGERSYFRRMLVHLHGRARLTSARRAAKVTSSSSASSSSLNSAFDKSRYRARYRFGASRVSESHALIRPSNLSPLDPCVQLFLFPRSSFYRACWARQFRGKLPRMMDDGGRSKRSGGIFTEFSFNGAQAD
jgi:hypothetical protein